MHSRLRKIWLWAVLVVAGGGHGAGAASTLEITLLDAQDSAPISDATVELWDHDSRISTVDADAGTARFEELPAGDYFLVADAPGYVRYLWHEKRFERQCLRSFSGSFPGDCPARLGDPIVLDGTSPQSVTAGLQRAGSLRLELTAADGSVPQSASVWLISWERYTLRRTPATSMQDGVVVIDELIPDEYFLMLQEDSRHIRMAYPDIPLSLSKSQRRSGDRVVIRPGETTDVHMTRIEGVTAFLDAEPSAGAAARDPFTNAIVGSLRPADSAPPRIFPEGRFFLQWGSIFSWISRAHPGQLCVPEECHRHPVEIVDFSKDDSPSLVIENADLSSTGTIGVAATFPFGADIGDRYSTFVSFALTDELGRIIRRRSTDDLQRTGEGWRAWMRFDNVPAGRYMLKINPFIGMDGEKIATVLHSGKRCRSFTCDPGPEDMFRLEEGQNLELDVFNSQTEDGFAGIDISLWDEELDEPIHDGRVFLYDDEFQLVNAFSVSLMYEGFTIPVEPGTYYLSTFPPVPGFAQINNANNAHVYSMNGVDHCGASCRIEDSEPVEYSGGNVAVRINQRRGLTLSGRVIQPDGEAGVSIGVELFTQTGKLYKKTFSGYSGRFRFFGLELGSYRVRTRNAQGFADTTIGGQRCDPDCDLQSDDSVELSDDHVTGMELSLTNSDRIFGNDFERLLSAAGRASNH